MSDRVFDLTDRTTVPPELGSLPPELVRQAPEVPAYLDWAEAPVELQGILTEQARPVSETRRAKPEEVRVVVRQLCAGRYLGRHVLAHLLQRNADDLLKRTLNPMVEAGHLKPAYAASRDPRQAYIASPNLFDEHMR
jgi:hypothetical protein